MHIEPYPATHIIKQRILVHAECNPNTEFKDKFAPDLIGKNTMAPLMTSLLNKCWNKNPTLLKGMVISGAIVFFPTLYCLIASTRNSIAADICIHNSSQVLFGTLVAYSSCIHQNNARSSCFTWQLHVMHMPATRKTHNSPCQHAHLSDLT